MFYAIRERYSQQYYRGNEWNDKTQSCCQRAVFGELDGSIKRYATLRKANAGVRSIISITGFDSPDALEVVQLLDPIRISDEPKQADTKSVKQEKADGSDCLSCPYFLDKPADSLSEKPEPEEPPPLYPVPEKETKGWELVAFVGEKKKPPLMLRRKQFADVTEYAIMLADGILYYLPGDELLAWSRYYDECKNFVCGRIRERRIKEGRDPDGMDEWR